MLYADDKLPEIIDVTSLPAELAREKDEDQEMTIKKIGRCSYFCYILYEWSMYLILSYTLNK